MFRDFASLPVKCIALYGFLLNMVWEFAQCTVLYDMWDWGLGRATVWMWGAIFGDVLIVLGVVFAACLLVGAANLKRLEQRGWLALLLVGFVASVLLEWLAQVLGLWGYSKWMPTVVVLGHPVGLAPILQVTVLPPCAVRFSVPKLGESLN